jgi:non-heme chloroperoxidase
MEGVGEPDAPGDQDGDDDQRNYRAAPGTARGLIIAIVRRVAHSILRTFVDTDGVVRAVGRMRILSAMALLVALSTVAVRTAAAADRWFTTSDGVHLHYIDRGAGHTIVLVPGWTMPAWIWEAQIQDFARRFHVVAFDPRGQGESDAAREGYDPQRRGQDIAELIDRLGPQPVLLVGWSLGVLDALAYIHTHGDTRLTGLVLVDNSVGEEPAPAPSRHRSAAAHLLSREARMRLFVRGMFAHPQPPAWLDRLTATCLRTPEDAAAALLSYPEPRSFWKEAIYATARPVLYVVTPRFAGQAENLRRHHPSAEAVVMSGVGHALFVDAPARFDALLSDFIRRRVWP